MDLVLCQGQQILSSNGLMIVSSAADVNIHYQLPGYQVKNASIIGNVFDKQTFRNKYGNTCQILQTSSQLLLSKQYIINYIKKIFKSATIIHLFYTGHGNVNGNWLIQILNDESINWGQISLDQILILWKQGKRNYQAELNIYMDCCYSGVWVKTLRKLKIDGINVYASCSDSQKSLSRQGGLFFRCLLGQEQKIAEVLQIINDQHQKPQFFQRQKDMAVTKQNILQIRSYISKTLEKTKECKKKYERSESPLKSQTITTQQQSNNMLNPQQQNKQPGLIFELQCHNPTCIDKPIHINIGKRGPYALQQQKSNCICPYCCHLLPVQNIRKISIRLTQKMIAKTYGLYQKSERRYQKQRDQHSMTKCGKNQCVLFDDIKTLDQRWASFEVLFEELGENL